MKRKASTSSIGTTLPSIQRDFSRYLSAGMNTHPMPPIVPSPSQSPTPPSTWLIIGASRGIGLEFTRQLLAQGHQVIAAVRDPNSASEIWKLAAGGHSPAASPVSPYVHSSYAGQQQLPNIRPGSCIIEQCDVTSETEIDAFVDRMRRMVERGGRIENVVLNAGILHYDRGLGAMNVGMEELLAHLRTNCVGPLIIARKLLQLNEFLAHSPLLGVGGVVIPGGRVVVGKKIIFISSDSGSMIEFRDFEDGFAAYAASKSALNMMIRHLSAELKRKSTDANETDSERQTGWESEICVLAMHPGEVQTDMADISVSWEVEGIISPQESVRDMLEVISEKDERHSGTFWCWNGREHPW